ncbi:hypothetical protein EGI22_16965 [Lacihabitans sp. LS3-19]|nr:hypothetical protein [Lacihabitans sp. LS3-19]
MPTVVAFVTMVSKKWGNSIGGILAGLPWVAGPIILFIAIEQGVDFAVNSIPGVMVGIIGWSFFCIAYVLVGRKNNALISVLAGYVAYATVGFALNPFVAYLNVYIWFALSLLVLFLGLVFFPKVQEHKAFSIRILRFEIPLRMIIITLFVITITFLAERLGPTWSGILTPFPVMTTVLAIFTHYTQGIYQVRKIYMGLFTGSLGFAFFLFLQAVLMPIYGIAMAFVIGILVDIVLTIAMKFVFSKYKLI